MRAVIDTNVLVSAMVNPHGTPARVIAAVLAGACTPLLDDRLVDEYRSVLLRPKFRFDKRDVEALIAALVTVGEYVLVRPLAVELPDPDDLPVLEVAVSAGADAVVTGNVRHFRAAARDLNVPLWSPAEMVARLVPHMPVPRAGR